MYAYISQKISLGKERSISAVTWEQENDVISVGFCNGGIKLLKFEDTTNGKNDTQLTLNVNLPSSHEEGIKTLSWNVNYDKLLSVDRRGRMVVWAENLGTYEEEMVNESPSKPIRFARWAKNGSFINIIIEGGKIILGNVEGDRIWELNVNINITNGVFFENDRTLVLTNPVGELVVVDVGLGEVFAEFDLKDEMPGEELELVCFESNNLESQYSRLLIAYSNGFFYLLQNLRDCDMNKLNYNFSKIYGGNWSKDGKLFSLSVSAEENSFVYLFDHNAKILKSFSTNKPTTLMDFNYNSTKLLISQKNFIYLTKIKPKHDFVYLKEKKVVGIKVTKENESFAYLYNVNTQELTKQHASTILSLYGDEQAYLATVCKSHKANCYELNLLDHNGFLISGKTIPFFPHLVSIGNKRVVISYFNYLLVWDFSTLVDQNTKSHLKTHKFFLIDIHNESTVNNITNEKEIVFKNINESEIVESICLTENFIFICDTKGFVKKYSVGDFSNTNVLILKTKPIFLKVSPNEQLMAVIDFYGHMTIYDIKKNTNEAVVFETKEVWSFFWNDHSLNCCYMSKNRAYELNLDEKDENEELVVREVAKTEGYILGFDFPSILIFDKDKFIDVTESFISENLNTVSLIDRHYTFALKQIKESIENDECISEQSFRKYDKKSLKFIGDLYLLKANYSESEKYYRYLNDYSSMTFVQRIKKSFQHNILKHAEILLFLGKEEEAVEHLVNNNKENYIIRMFMDHQRFDNILDYKHLLDAKTLEEVYDKLGQHAFLKMDYEKAIKFFQMNNNVSKLIDVYFAAEKFEQLQSLKTEVKLEEDKEKLALKLLEANILGDGVKLYESLREEKKAVDVAILHNHWSTAVEIAGRNNFQQIENLIQKFAGILTKKKKKFELVQLFKKAKKNLEAAKILNSIAEDSMLRNSDALMVKKIFVLSALEVYLQNKQMTDVDLTANLTNLTLTDQTRNATMKTLATLITSDVTNLSDKIMTNPWKGAEAWHLYLLTLNFLKKNDFYDAFIVANKLINYELELETERVYLLITITAYLSKLYKQFAKALNQLSRYYQRKSNTTMVKRIDDLIIETFKEKEPVDHYIDKRVLKCIAKNCEADIYDFDSYCKTCGSNFGFCVVSGKSIFNKDYQRCRICKHKLLKDYIKQKNIQFCTLCHGKLDKGVPSNADKK